MLSVASAVLATLCVASGWSLVNSDFNSHDAAGISTSDVVECLLYCARQVPDDATPLAPDTRTDCACLALLEWALSASDVTTGDDQSMDRLDAFMRKRSVPYSLLQRTHARDRNKRFRFGLEDDPREQGKPAVDLWQDKSSRKAFRYG